MYIFHCNLIQPLEDIQASTKEMDHKLNLFIPQFAKRWMIMLESKLASCKDMCLVASD